MAYRMLVDGALHSGCGEIDVVNPATGQVFARACRADADLLNAAVAAAKLAAGQWGKLTFSQRGEVVTRLADALTAHFDDLLSLLVREQGKPIAQAADEVGGSIAVLRYFAGLALEEETLVDSPVEKVIRHRTPLGVVAAIAPWNFPVLLMLMKVAPALMAGNSVVCKPAPTTPLTMLLIGEIAQDIVPPGVLNILVDANDLGEALTAHPDVAKVSFTGSTATGRKVMASAAAGVKRLSLELGGNDAAIVLDDADIKQVVPRVFDAATRNAGQICFAAKRLFVPLSAYDGFCNELAVLAEKCVVGDGFDPRTEMGPIQNAMQFAKLKDYLAIAHAEGRIVAGGEASDRDGFFIRPTVVRDLPESSALVQEEQFGPIMPVLAYDDLDALVARLNAGSYGLGGTIWTASPERGLAVAKRIDSGVVWVNRHLELGFDVPMGGSKHSGLGVENGIEGLESFTQPHVVSIKL